jgi:hypothetical protein
MSNLSNLFRVVLVAVVFATVHTVSLAAEQGTTKGGGIILSDSVSAKATIVNIKKKERELTLRDEKGAEIVVVAGKEVRNFDQIKKGDIVEVEYHVAVASLLEKVSDSNVAGQTTNVARAPAGDKPGMAAMHTSSIVATVLEIDKKNRLLTAQGPKGGIVTIKVPADIKAFDSLKKGDKISAVHSEAVAISIKSPAKKK